MLYGHEYTLLIFELMMFVTIDLWAQSFTLAAIVTLFFSHLIKRIFLSAVRRNLVKKALIDERFLI